MAAYFIADLHLSEDCPELISAFSAFVARLSSGDELYILGDLFNYYIGLDSQNAAQQAVKQVLQQASAKDIHTYFIRGNRDFLINRSEATALHMSLLDDCTLLPKAHCLICASHGDAFCTNDIAYQKYAKTVSNPFYQFLFRCLPFSVRRKIGQKIRAKSKQMHSYYRDPSIYGVVVSSVSLAFAKQLEAAKGTLNSPTISTPSSAENNLISSLNNIPYIVIHGHIHEFSQFNNEAKNYDTRYVLGAWGENYSYLKYDDCSGLSFIEESLDCLIIK